jgi:predicted hotdog family 3-hydroxylacyl-ACP dehydratase
MDAGRLLPHEPPMVCIDRLLFASAEQAQTLVCLRPGHILLHNGQLCAAGYVEIAAQSAGAMQGFARLHLGLPAQEGFLAAVQDFVISGRAREGDCLVSTVRLQAEVGGVLLIRAETVRKESDGREELLAKGTLKVFVPERGNG